MDGRVRHLAIAAGLLVVAWIVLYWYGSILDGDGAARSAGGSVGEEYQPKVTVVEELPGRFVPLPPAVHTEPMPRDGVGSSQVESPTDSIGTGSGSASAADQSQVGDAQSTATTYTVQRGDTLSEIAKRVYGRSALWRVIRDANVQLTGDDGRRIRPGMVLVLPRVP